MESKKEITSKLPHAPGVYVYRDSSQVIIYVGKAKDLKKRVSQYFQRDDAVGTKTAQLVSQIDSIETVSTHSEFDALLLEAKLIRENQPKYNVIAKDDKSPLYVSISFDEDLPRIQYVRRSAITTKSGRMFFGPFQSGYVIRKLLRQIRRVIPYCTQKIRNGSPCFYTHIGQCGPCPSVIAKLPEGVEKKEKTHIYRLHIRRIADILEGKSGNVIHDLEAEMNEFAASEEFEKAQESKLYIDRLKQLMQTNYDPSLYMQNDSFLENLYDNELTILQNHLLPYYPGLQIPKRIECVDISNTMGSASTASLVVLINGRPDNSQYKRFRMRTKDAPNDFAMIHEVVSRRLKHTEWEYPDILVIDGGRGQVHAASRALHEGNATIPIIGLAKRFEDIIVPVGEKDIKVLRLNLSDKGLHVIQRIRDESHRFALKYHRLLRKKSFLKKITDVTS